jgi:hypothetical protein
MTRADRLDLAKKRLVNILKAQTVCCDRTLEQKISDAGPNPQRVEPSVLTVARNELVQQGVIRVKKEGNAPWYYLKGVTDAAVEERMRVLVALHRSTQDGVFKNRVGQTLEIAVMKAIQRSGIGFLGSFPDLEKHDDSTAYTKVDPPLDINGKRMEKGPLDFVVFPGGVCTGIEVKNYRTWLYPRSTEVKELLWKCGDVGAVPVLIARRLPFITIRLLQMGGCLIHENYNQLYPVADAKLADAVRTTNLLGYHDVRIGNEPDKRMLRFIGELLPVLAKGAGGTFQTLRETHRAYGMGEISYAQWLKALRAQGTGAWTKGVRDEAKAEGKGSGKGKRGRGTAGMGKAADSKGFVKGN